ncbi:Cation efflux protein [Blastocystis hominis]|uniref:Cation efflux protein n=1 Tax=Blastocystis hominis TaxID=12968 RepID=D8LZV7_BLAHO|nr:Cation efflux protein [Blastocystis hominis]CBK21346.2 Cation efflux protein [Blastocystis hominis]|eukprot:XP_012895394.1 Cation efflux protein [Blastocystis hominis]
MLSVLHRTTTMPLKLFGLSQGRTVVLGLITPISNVRPLSFNTPAQLSRKEREIMRRRHVKEGNMITYVGAGVNITLSALKGLSGYLLHSPALIADAVHSLSDLIADGMTLLTVRKSRQDPNDLYPYGHGKVEALGAMGIACFLVGTALLIGWDSYLALKDILVNGVVNDYGASSDLLTYFSGPGVLALAIVSKEILFRVTKKIGERNKSSVLIANAYHHRSDVWASVVALGGLGGSYFGIPWCDPVGGIAVGALIAKTGFDLLSGNYYNLMDRQDLNENEEMTQFLNDVGIPCCSLRHRHHGALVYVDMTLEVDDLMTAKSLIELERRAKDLLSEHYSDIHEVLVSFRLKGDSNDSENVVVEDPMDSCHFLFCFTS